MRVFISGQKQFGAEIFKLCQRLGMDIAGVSAPPFAKDGKRHDRLRQLAGDNNVPWLLAGTLTADTLPTGIDIIVCAHSHDFIGQRTRHKARLGAIGYHPSLLPLHRGRDAVRWAIKMGDKVTGGSVYWLSETIDGGAIAAQSWCFIHPGDTPEELWRRDLFPLGIALMEKCLRDLLRGVIVAVPQDESLASWEPSFDRAPLYRPDLLLIGNGLSGFTIETSKAAADL